MPQRHVDRYAPLDVVLVVLLAMLGRSSSPATCFCPACWDSTTGVAVRLPAPYCETWRREAEEWLWASCAFDCDPMEVDSPLRENKNSCNTIAWFGAAAEVSEEIWLYVFLIASDDCPGHSLSVLSELSAVTKRAASALRTRRAEHLRLLLVNLEVERQYDIVMRDREQDRMDLEAFEDAWSVDSDGNWRDRFYDRYYDEGPPRPFIPLPAPSQGVLLQRRLQLAEGLPTFPTLYEGSSGRVAPPLLTNSRYAP